MRGGLGEVRLEMLLEQVLAPEQYEANVKTKKGSSDMVEFAIKLPGKDDEKERVYLPIDAKFPQDAYHHLTDAYEIGDIDAIEPQQRALMRLSGKWPGIYRKSISTRPIPLSSVSCFCPLKDCMLK